MLILSQSLPILIHCVCPLNQTTSLLWILRSVWNRRGLSTVAEISVLHTLHGVAHVEGSPSQPLASWSECCGLNLEDGKYQSEFQDPKMEVPTIHKAYATGYTPKIWPYMVQYLHFWILEFPLKVVCLRSYESIMSCRDMLSSSVLDVSYCVVDLYTMRNNKKHSRSIVKLVRVTIGFHLSSDPPRCSVVGRRSWGMVRGFGLPHDC